MLKSFMVSILKEKINYVPNYLKNLNDFRKSMDLNGVQKDDPSSEHCLRLRVEI